MQGEVLSCGCSLQTLQILPVLPCFRRCSPSHLHPLNQRLTTPCWAQGAQLLHPISATHVLSQVKVTANSVCLPLRKPELEQQGRKQQQVTEGKDGFHKGAATGAGGWICPPQLLDKAQEIRDSCEPGPHRKTSTSPTLSSPLSSSPTTSPWSYKADWLLEGV